MRELIKHHIKNSIKIFSGLFQRMFLVYIVVGVILVMLINPRQASVRRLNSTILAARYPIEYAKNQKGEADHQQLRFAIRYYTLLKKTLPHVTRSDGMLAFCYYHLGDANKAIDYYKKSLNKRSQLFWYDYNLAIIYYFLNDARRSIIHLKRVLSYNPKELRDYAALNALNRMPEEKQRSFYIQARDFAFQIQSNSQKLLIKNLMKGGKYKEATEIIRQLDRKDDTQSWQPQLVIHPWADRIPIGREIFYVKEIFQQ